MENYVLLITVGTFASIIATILVLLTRLAFYRIRDTFPAGSLFHGIANSPITCHIYVLRMKDKEGRGEFITPIPEYSPSGSNNKYESRQLTPWVTSLAETQALSLIFNVLGRIGRTENIELMYADTDYHRWRAPMFILGGSWKAIQALEKCDPYFMIESDKGFRLIPNEQLFSPLSTDEDLGLLQKMINPVTGLPVWVVMGWRGNGTVAAAYALVRWWRYFGKLYGNKPFGLLVSMDDRAGWEQSSIRVIHPEPSDYKKLCHLIAWYRLKGRMEQKETSGEIEARKAKMTKSPPMTLSPSSVAPGSSSSSVSRARSSSSAKPSRNSTAEEEKS